MSTQPTDLHTAEAAKIFNVKPEDVTREQRRYAKSVNYNLLYATTAKSTRSKK